MDYRNLGASGLRVPVLSFGAGTFGGSGPLFGAWGNTDAEEARRLVDICLEAGVNLFDTADVYSVSASEEVLGQAIRGKRDAVLISTKTALPMGEGPQDWGTSRARLIRATEDALRLLGPTISTSCSFTPSMPRRRSRRCCRRSTGSSPQARSAMSAFPILLTGN